jgi:hypothetical protein
MKIRDEDQNKLFKRLANLIEKYGAEEPITDLENPEIEEVINDILKVGDYPNPKETFPLKVVSKELNEDDDDSKNRLEVLNKELKEIKKSITRLERQNLDLKKRLELLTNNEKNRLKANSIETLQEIGFKPITMDILKNYSEEEAEKCKRIIKEEIRTSNGRTDPLVISEKNNLPLELVAGCFDFLLKTGEIGEVDD